MTAGILLGLVIGGFLVAMAAALGAATLRDFSAHELEQWCLKHRREDLFSEIIDLHEKVVVGVECFRTLGVAVTVAAAAVLLTSNSLRAFVTTGTIITTAIGIGILLIVAIVLIPRAVVETWSAPFLGSTWRFWCLLNKLATPLTIAVVPFSAGARRLSGRHDETASEADAFEDDILSLVSEGYRDGLLEADAREMIEGVIELDDVDVADIMTPRSEVNAMDANLTWPEVLEFVILTRRTRIPVYKDNLDKIIGILYVKDLLPELAKENPADRCELRTLLRSPWFVPTTKMVDELLQEFLENRNHLAIAVDEYHSIAGVVTIEDVLEEIVGEIVDEHDIIEDQDIMILNATTAEIGGRAHLDEVNEALGYDLPEDEDVDTIGGLMISRLGRIPVKGDSIDVSEYKIEVLTATERQVEKVRLTKRKD